MTEIWNLSTLCRCCHADGHFKSLNISYQSKNDVEIYENLLLETLGVLISTPPLEASHTICDACIFKLREAAEFKKQVLACEQKFQFYCNNEQFTVSCDIKSEGESEQTDSHQDDDTQVKDEQLVLEVKKENPPINEIAAIIDYTEKPSEIRKKTLRNYENCNKQKIPKQEEQQNPPINEIAAINDCTEKPSEIRKKTLKNNYENCNKQKITKQEEQRRKRVTPDYSLIIQVDTDTGTQFSCKNCGGLFKTQKEINQHLNKVHPSSYKCEYCQKKLKSFETYKNHLKVHTGTNNQCTYCPKNFTSKQSLKHHLNSHTLKKVYTCDLCQKNFKYKNSLVGHFKVHAGTNKTILCHLCGRSFNDKANLNAHTRTVHEKLRPFQCKICKKTYSNQRHLRDHLKLHNGTQKIYKCDRCDHKVTCQRTMEIHRLKHDGKFLCRFCPEIFENSALRTEHSKVVHNKIVQWHPCPICGKILVGKYTLNRHMEVHKAIKRFPCEDCGEKFSQKSSLKRHISRKHDSKADTADINIDKTKCDICKRSYKNIVVHMQIHENRLCVCPICGSTYPNNSALNRHKALKHFGTTFNCDLCQKKYLQKDNLNAHKLKVHPIKSKKKPATCESDSHMKGSVPL